MPTFTLTIKDTTVGILFDIASNLSLPEHLTLEEKLSTAIDAIADSMETVSDVEVVSAGEPLQMQDALEAILNPNISSTYTPPSTPIPVSKNLTWEDIIALRPDIESNGALDEVVKESICIVFNELPTDEWDTPHAKALIEKTHYLVMYRKKSHDEGRHEQ